MKIGRFIVDTHVHSQRHAVGPVFQEKGWSDPAKIKYSQLAEVMSTIPTYDNSKRLLYDMECYGVDMCILSSAFGMNNDLNVALVEKYPDKFRALCRAYDVYQQEAAGEIQWSMEAACQELDGLLATGNFVGIGEGMPSPPHGPQAKKTMSQTQRMDELRLVMEVARKHQVPVRLHSGSPMGYPIAYTFWPESFHPLWAQDLAFEYPDVPIVFDHGGMQGGRYEHWVDECLLVAANHDNVYLETGLYWTDLYYKALADPNVGAEKLLWGTDWGASIPIVTQLGLKPQTYAMQTRKGGIVAHQVDVMGWSLKQLARLDISQDDLNLILGGNASRIYKLDLPLSRMFREVE